MSGSPFTRPDGSPTLVRCAVLYFDLLGVSAMAVGPEAEQDLVDFDSTIRAASPYPLGGSADEREDGAYPSAVFSDSFIAAVPITDGLSPGLGVFQLAMEAARLQTDLATRGYFARGAITLDRFHFHRGLLFGPALVEAVGLERSVALEPRIVLSPAAAMALLGQESGDEGGAVYATAPVLVDEDRVAFVDYLAGALEADPEIELLPTLEAHRDVVTSRLAKQASNYPRWSKYRWVAEYHNATCSTYGEALSGHGSPTVEVIVTERRFSAFGAADP